MFASDHVACGVGWILLVLPTLYWVVIDFSRFKTNCSKSKINLSRNSKKSSINNPNKDDENEAFLKGQDSKTGSILKNKSPNIESINKSNRQKPKKQKIEIVTCDDIAKSKMKQYEEIQITPSTPLRMEPIEKVLKPSNIVSWFGLMMISYIFVRIAVNTLNWKRVFKYTASSANIPYHASNIHVFYMLIDIEKVIVRISWNCVSDHF